MCLTQTRLAPWLHSKRPGLILPRKILLSSLNLLKRSLTLTIKPAVQIRLIKSPSKVASSSKPICLAFQRVKLAETLNKPENSRLFPTTRFYPTSRYGLVESSNGLDGDARSSFYGLFKRLNRRGYVRRASRSKSALDLASSTNSYSSSSSSL